MENTKERNAFLLSVIIDVIGIIVTIVSIITSILSIVHDSKRDKQQKSNRPHHS